MPSLEFQRIQYAALREMPPHVDACRRLSIVLSGSLDETRRGDRERSGPGSVAIKADDLVHHDHFGPAGADILSVVLPDALLEELHLAEPLQSWRWHHDGAPRRLAWRLALAGLRRDGFAVEAALAELTLQFAARPPRSTGPGPRPRLLSIRARLHEAPETEVSVRELAREEGLHPVTLGQQFRRAFGCSITAYRRRLRAEQAACDLSSSCAPLSRVALDHGFHDQSHMNRVFRRELGVAPGVFRRLVGPPAAPLKPYKTEWSVTV